MRYFLTQHYGSCVLPRGGAVNTLLCQVCTFVVWLHIVWLYVRNTMRIIFLLGLLVISGLRAWFICFWLCLFLLK